MDDFASETFEVMPLLHLENQLCFSVYSLSRSITQRYTPLLKPLDLTYPQYLVMLVLWQALEEGEVELTIGHLSQRLKLDTGTATPLLKRMAAKELLARQRSAQDERIVLIQLTEKGRALREQAKAIPYELLCQANINPEQVIELRERLTGLLAALD